MWSRKRTGCVAWGYLMIFVLMPTDGQAFPWNHDMAEQPAVQPYTQPMPLPPAGTLAQGREWPVSRTDRALLPENPLAGEASATQRGKKLYAIYCTTCHGETGRGDGPMSTKVGQPSDLTGRIPRRRSDGYFYAVIREGTSTMPAHGAILSSDEHWAVVNYIRTLQGLEDKP